jgi:DNA-binding LacI/PurR family transcriptional regulator
VSRLLQKFIEEGSVWQHEDGRYYPASAREKLHRPKPVACLTRRLELCSQLYREILEGISVGCGAHRRTMLLWHDDALVNHPDVALEPVFASPKRQRAILSDYLERHGETAGGFVLDHVWDEAVLREFADRLAPGVVLFRSSAIPSLGNVRVDFRSGIQMALTHLLARGYDTIRPVAPFARDPAMDEFFATLDDLSGALGCRDRLLPPVPAGTAEQRRELTQELRQGSGRTALLIPEDNVAMAMRSHLETAGVACPGKVGVLSGMGTDFAVQAGLSCLRHDFRALGRRAVEALEASRPVREVVTPQFQPGSTT